MHQFHIFHETTYEYAQPVVLGEHRLLLRPREDHDVKIKASKLVIEPNASVNWVRDEQSNSLAIATFDDTPVSRLTITSEIQTDHFLTGEPETYSIDPSLTLPISYDAQLQDSLMPWLLRRVEGEQFDNWLQSLRTQTGDSLKLMLDMLNEAIFSGFEYSMREEPGVQSPDETLKLGRGSCRDYAWLFIIAARTLGIAARFVSGYLHTSVEHLDSHTHAWAEIYLPKGGWVGYDPTCNVLATENHIPIAVSRLPEAVPPISGTYTGQMGIDTMDVKVKVTQINQDPAQAHNQQVQDAPELEVQGPEFQGPELQGPEIQGPEIQGQRIPAQDILAQDIQAQESEGS